MTTTLRHDLPNEWVQRLAPEILDIETASHCGREIARLFRRADDLLRLIDGPARRAQVVDAVIKTAAVIYFG